MNRPGFGFGAIESNIAEILIRLAIDEDLGDLGDITSAALIPSDATGSVRVVARSIGVLAGLSVVERLVAGLELEATLASRAKRWRSSRAGRSDRAVFRSDAIAAASSARRSIFSST